MNGVKMMDQWAAVCVHVRERDLTSGEKHKLPVYDSHWIPSK